MQSSPKILLIKTRSRLARLDIAEGCAGRRNGGLDMGLIIVNLKQSTMEKYLRRISMKMI